MDEQRERRRGVRPRREQVDELAQRGAVAQAELGAALLHGFGAVVLGLARPARKNLRMLGHARAVVVFGLVIGRHAVLPRSSLYHLLPSGGERARRARRHFAFVAGARYVLSAMKVDGRQTRTIWVEPDGWSVGIIDQTQLPHRFATIRLATLDDAAHAIAAMQVRGAPLIGATAAYGICLALRADASDEALERAYARLIATRPTAINLKWALDEMVAAVRNRAAGAPRCRRLSPRRRDLRRGRRHQPGDRPPRAPN